MDSCTENPAPKSRRQSRTKITFDLADVLTDRELVAFRTRAVEAGAKSLTEHFVKLTLGRHLKRAEFSKTNEPPKRLNPFPAFVGARAGH